MRDPTEVAAIAKAAREFERSGQIVLELHLSSAFAPPVVDAFVFAGDGSDEIAWYVPETVRYLGGTDVWRTQMRQPAVATARLLWRSSNGFIGSLAELSDVLDFEAQNFGDQPLASRIALPRPQLCAPSPELDRGAAAAAEVEDLVSRLTSAVQGQDDVVRELAEIVVQHRYKAVKRRPCVVLAVGPTATGKTKAAEELALALAQLHPRAGYHTVRIDCGNLAEPHAIARLTGAPAGYVGHGSSESLADVVAAHPHSIVLLDELEKAHPNLFPLFLSTFNDGRLQRASSPDSPVDATDCIFIATSNLNCDVIVRGLDQARAWGDRVARQRVTLQALSGPVLRPEFLGRIRAILPFRPLSDEVRREIARRAVIRLGADYEVTVVDVADSVVKVALEAASDPRLGARPLEHAIEALLAPMFLRVPARDANEYVITGDTSLVRRTNEPAPVATPSPRLPSMPTPAPAPPRREELDYKF